MKSTDVRAPFLVLAHHRSGSNFVHDLLQAHPGIECINEPLSMHTRFFRQCDLVRWSEGDYDPAALHVAMAGHAGLRDYLGELREYLLRSTCERIVGFKETGLFGKLEWLKAFMPSLKLIFLTRDPRAIVSSVLRSGLLEFWAYHDLVPAAFREICPAYVSRVPESDAAARQAEIAAMSVATRYELASRTVPLFEHRRVSLEDLMQDPVDGLRTMTDLLEIEPHADQVAFLRRRQLVSRGGPFSSFRHAGEVQAAWRQYLSPHQIEAIEDVLRAAKRANATTDPGGPA